MAMDHGDPPAAVQHFCAKGLRERQARQDSCAVQLLIPTTRRAARSDNAQADWPFTAA